jgi:hypothetical protein
MNIYVDPKKGSNKRDGLSIQTAVKTVQCALDISENIGDIYNNPIYIRRYGSSEILIEYEKLPKPTEKLLQQWREKIKSAIDCKKWKKQ